MADKKTRKGTTRRRASADARKLADDVLKLAERALYKLSDRGVDLSPSDIIKFLTLGYELQEAEFDETDTSERKGISALAESIRALAEKTTFERDKKGRNNL
jgi:hypothetical protein